MRTTIHSEAEIWATAAAMGGLTQTELKAWNGHVAICPACKNLYNEELTMNKLVKNSLQSERPDPGFERRIISKFRQVHAQKASPWRHWLGPVPVMSGLAAACVVILALIAVGAQMKEKTKVMTASANLGIDWKAVPPAVQQTIQSNSNGRTVSHVERNDDNGRISYDVATQSKDGEEWDLTVGDDGTLLSIDIAPSEIPSLVRTAIDKQVGQGTLEGVARQFDDGETIYLAGITSPDKTERDFCFAADGTLLSKEVNLTELSPAVQTAINTQVGQGRLDGIDKTYDDEKITYEATMITPKGEERNFSVSSEGTLLSREVSMAEVPATVKRTISQTLGEGKIIEVDKSLVTENQTTGYEIESEKDGNAFDFRVSPTGHFLGTE